MTTYSVKKEYTSLKDFIKSKLLINTPYVFKDEKFYLKEKYFFFIFFDKLTKIGEYTYLIYSAGNNVVINSCSPVFLDIIKKICDEYNSKTGDQYYFKYVLDVFEAVK